MTRYRLLMMIQLAGSVAILAFVPGNLLKLVAFPIWWAVTFRRVTVRQLVLNLVAAVFFTVMDYLTLRQGIFRFTYPDFLLMPCYEPLLWGYLLLHTLHMVNGPTPRGRLLLPAALAVVFAVPFLVITDPVVLFVVSGVILAVGLIIYHEVYDLAYVGYFVLVGTLWEYAGIWSGQWSYPDPPPGGLPPWFAPMWGGIALLLRRLVLPFLRPGETNDGLPPPPTNEDLRERME